MKNYVITLENYPTSRGMTQIALETANEHGWAIEPWPGVDGMTVPIEILQSRYRLSVCAWDKKCSTMFKSRPGVRGCFLSHYALWQHCIALGGPIGIFEHDVVFVDSPDFSLDFRHVLKLEGFDRQASRPAGHWYEGARAYVLQPEGAARLVAWVRDNGCLPTDVCIGTNVVEIKLCDRNQIKLQHQHSDKQDKHVHSFTWNLQSMPRD